MPANSRRVAAASRPRRGGRPPALAASAPCRWCPTAPASRRPAARVDSCPTAPRPLRCPISPTRRCLRERRPPPPARNQAPPARRAPPLCAYDRRGPAPDPNSSEPPRAASLAAPSSGGWPSCRSSCAERRFLAVSRRTLVQAAPGAFRWCRAEPRLDLLGERGCGATNRKPTCDAHDPFPSPFRARPRGPTWSRTDMDSVRPGCAGLRGARLATGSPRRRGLRPLGRVRRAPART